jgi:sugar/nucleoside kinase (ribokinase family)
MLFSSFERLMRLTCRSLKIRLPSFAFAFCLVVTLGAHGCEVWEGGQKTVVAPVKAQAVVDPTGCGDAWRGALLFGLDQGWPLTRCAALGNHVGALKIAQRGPQNYQIPAGLVASILA